MAKSRMRCSKGSGFQSRRPSVRGSRSHHKARRDIFKCKSSRPRAASPFGAAQSAAAGAQMPRLHFCHVAHGFLGQASFRVGVRARRHPRGRESRSNRVPDRLGEGATTHVGSPQVHLVGTQRLATKPTRVIGSLTQAMASALLEIGNEFAHDFGGNART